jgi:hypothetical protein
MGVEPGPVEAYKPFIWFLKVDVQGPRRLS